MGSTAISVGRVWGPFRCDRQGRTPCCCVSSWLRSQDDHAEDGVRAARVWKAVLGVQHTAIEGVLLDAAGTEEVLVARVRPTRSRQGRCGRCQRRAPGYDAGGGGAAGGAWTWALFGCTWRPTRRGWPAQPTG